MIPLPVFLSLTKFVAYEVRDPFLVKQELTDFPDFTWEVKLEGDFDCSQCLGQVLSSGIRQTCRWRRRGWKPRWRGNVPKLSSLKLYFVILLSGAMGSQMMMMRMVIQWYEITRASWNPHYKWFPLYDGWCDLHKIRWNSDFVKFWWIYWCGARCINIDLQTWCPCNQLFPFELTASFYWGFK